MAVNMLEDKNQTSLEDLHHLFAKDNACYVLITCKKPAQDGKMQVEMTFDGDPALAAYLIESAQGLIDPQTESLIS